MWNNPIKYNDPDGNCPMCILYAAFEIGSSAADVHDVVTTFSDPNASTRDKVVSVVGASAGLILPGGGYSKVDDVVDLAKGVDKTKDTSRAARREVMRDQGIPTSQPLIPDKATKSKDKVFTTRDKNHTVQDAKNDRGHEGQPHWEAGPTKKDPSTSDGLNRSGNNNKPQMAKPKSKAYYKDGNG